MKKNIFLGLFAVTLLVFSACSNKDKFEYYYYTPEDTALLSQYLNLPDEPYQYTQDLSKVDFFGVQIPINSDKASLGRVLFYDTKLSASGKVSCGTCHQQQFAFGENTAVSTGVFERQGERNSIALMSIPSFASQYGTDQNGSLGKRFFWDNRAPTAQAQAIGSMTNPKEMDMTMEEIVDEVQRTSYYVPLFRKAYGSTDITEERITVALAEFINSIGSTNSRFDFAAHNARQKGIDPVSNNLPDLSAAENAGKALYVQKCGNCHGKDLFQVPLDQANNGLDLTTKDQGVGAITGRETEMGNFKVPSLRNITKTAPYMHDGRLKTLEDVIEHYSSGIKNHPNLSTELKPFGTPVQMNFTSTEKQNLIAFLETLTDESVLVDPKFSDPFKK